MLKLHTYFNFTQKNTVISYEIYSETFGHNKLSIDSDSSRVNKERTSWIIKKLS
jgi:hypothetical protein